MPGAGAVHSIIRVEVPEFPTKAKRSWQRGGTTRTNLNGAPATACQGSSESSAPPDLVRLSPEQLHRPELPEARCPVRAGGQLLFWVVMFQ